MAITKLNSLAIPANTVVAADLSYPLTSFSSTGIDDNATSTAITIDASENVGIAGELSADDLFTLNGTTSATASIVAAVNEDATLKLLEAGAGDVGARLTYDGGDNKLYMQTGNNPPVTRMTINRDDGNVGIGTASPSRLLTLSDSGGCLLSLVSTNDDNCQVLFGDSASDTVGKVVYAHDTNHMRFETNAAERMRIDSSGNLIVGATSAGNAKVTSVNGVAFEARDGTQPFYQWYNSGGGTDLKYWRCGNNTSGDLPVSYTHLTLPTILLV